jgi:branched-chain amino acid transport system ATP-binding protein
MGNLKRSKMTQRLEKFIWELRRRPMLELVDIHTYYGESHVLQGISLKVEEGSVVALLGRNGMGKTTTVHSIIGFTPPRRGKVIFKGEDITHLQCHKIPLLGIALVPQGRRIFPSLSVKENLTIAARGGNGDAWTLDRIYSLFPVLKERANLRGNLLSGGELQMLSIARALMTNPDLLLMDEPSEGLAPLIVRELGDVIKQLHKSGHTILLVEQNLRMALEVADYVYILSKGVIVYQSMAEELRDNSEIQTMHLGVTGKSV